jgi:hypothetical protein
MYQAGYKALITWPDGMMELVVVLLLYRSGLLRVAPIAETGKICKSRVLVCRAEDLTPLS